MPESTRLPPAARLAASPGAGSVTGWLGVGARGPACALGRPRDPALPRARGIRARVAFPPAAFHRASCRSAARVELGTAACFGAAAFLALGLAARTRRDRARPRPAPLPALRAGRPLRRRWRRSATGSTSSGGRRPRWFAEQNAQQRDEPPQPVRRPARPDAPQSSPSRRSRWAASCCRPRPCGPAGSTRRGRWPYYLLPRGELIPLVGGMLLMRLFRTLPGRVRGGLGSRSLSS